MPVCCKIINTKVKSSFILACTVITTNTKLKKNLETEFIENGINQMKLPSSCTKMIKPFPVVFVNFLKKTVSYRKEGITRGAQRTS